MMQTLWPHLLEAMLNYEEPSHFHHRGLYEPSHNPTAMYLVERPGVAARRPNQLRPWRRFADDSGLSTFSSSKNEFKVNLDVQQFKPDELKIKVVDGFLVVDGKHEERSDEHGFIARQFTRRYKIPEDVDQEKLASNLSSDGVLSISAPRILKEDAQGREIPIIQTNQPAVQQSSAQSEGKGEDKQDNKMES